MTTSLETMSRRSLAASLETMMLIRAFEATTARMRAEGKGGAVCTSDGQEASAVGVMSALDERDRILTNHRSAGHLLARGADPGRVLAEIMGKATGYCSGKSGSLHISVKELGVVLTSTIVGGELSLATGVALSQQMLGEPGITAVFFGDGAASEGIFHESVNLAAVWNLPVLYVCENNQWQAYVHRRETMLGDHISEWAKPYGIKTRTVDGNDVEAVAEAAQLAADYVRTNRKPFLLETYTYRLRGHMSDDTQQYVDQKELAYWKSKDPITRLEERFIGSEVEAIKARVDERIEAAIRFAVESPYPGFDQLTTQVYA